MSWNMLHMRSNMFVHLTPVTPLAWHPHQLANLADSFGPLTTEIAHDLWRRS